MIGWLLDPFALPFMQTALAASLLIGLVTSLLGVYVVHRRMAFIGDALAHTTLPGVAIAYLSGTSLALGATFAAVFTAVVIAWLSRRQQLREDTAIGIVFTGMFALGVLIMSHSKTTRNLTDVLLGNVLAVTSSDLWLIGGVATVVSLVLFLLHKELELTSFDPTHAAVIGLNPDRIRFGLLVLIALTVVTAIQVIGLILTTALLVTPAATGSILTNRLSRTMLVSAAVATFSAVVGLLTSYHWRVPAGAAIVLTAVAVFMMVGFVSRLRQAKSIFKA
jgi:ABC-type Mn2+/Zn2+ transport system permease subunit